MYYEKRACHPYCKPPDKRDFQSYNPEKSFEDFYRNYDPMVGIGTAAILLSIIFLISVKSFIRWIIRNWESRKYAKSFAEKVEKRVSFVENKTRMSVRRLERISSKKNSTKFIETIQK
ncbi:unnamed protein product [Meloidogyne enterolobii]|uniref:Uncharacterized protein n=2 Tax=Meloidogyne enterolobii TaxID=390850 RepID=A0A6V7TUF3_MELEN|nr:unnamed protein product [Meloidogyne enterolobii]